MSLGTALLQPHLLVRAAPDPEAALIDEVVRLIAVFGEDAARGGPMAAAAEAAVLDSGPMLQAEIAPRLATAQAKLRGRLNAPRAWLEGVAAAAEAATDASAIVALFRSLLGGLRAAVDGLGLPGIRRELEFWKDLLETDLHLGPAFLADVVRGYLAALSARLAAIAAGGDADGERRRRLAIAILGRLLAALAGYQPPGIEVEPLARLLDGLLRGSGFARALGEIDCALDDVEAAFAVAEAAGSAVRTIGPLLHRSGLIPMDAAPDYSWYASWLLNDQDVPLLGLSDVEKPREFVAAIGAGANPLTSYLRDRFAPAERTILDGYTDTSQDPARPLLLTVLAVVNRTMQRTPILDEAGGGPNLGSDQLTDEIRELQRDFAADQSLLLYNRRVLERGFGDQLSSFSGGFMRWLGRFAGGIAGLPRNQVFVTGDGRFVMCDDKPMHVGEAVKWHEAPMFAEDSRGALYFEFEHVKPRPCEIFAQVLHAVADTGKGIWHLVDLPPGHAVAGGIIGGVELADAVQEVLFGRPISGYFLEGGPHLRRWGKSLDSMLGIKGITTAFGSLQGVVGRDDNDLFRYWLTVFMGDAIRTAGPVQTVNILRDVLLAGLTLYNFGGPKDAPSTLPSNPAANHLKQAPFVSVMDTVFAMALVSLYPRDNYSVFIWSKDGIGDRRKSAMLGHWLGGSAGLGLLAGLAGSLVAQIIAWAEDFKRFFATGGISALKMFLLFWVYNYLFRENATDGGRYRADGGSFKGYPPRDSSPYRLPYPGGEGRYVGQANLGLFSHNFITNTDFVTPADSAPVQVYAYDFNHELHEGIACVRSGVIWEFTETVADSDESDWNVLVIRHDTIDPVHDDFGRGPVQTYTVYGHLAENGVTNAPAFGGMVLTQEKAMPGGGTPVTRGQLIAQAGDTGMSFHNHLHLHVVPDDGTGAPDLSAHTIPFVFGDAPGDGNLKSITWYRSGNS